MEERKRYISVAQQAGFEIIGYYFESKIADALQRNEQKEIKARVPAKGILGTYNKLEIPSIAEGFDALYYVKTTLDGMFSVTDWLA